MMGVSRSCICLHSHGQYLIDFSPNAFAMKKPQCILTLRVEVSRNLNKEETLCNCAKLVRQEIQIR